jgi:group I intron endonuclease
MIYMATNKITGKSYIGKTTQQLAKRVASHYSNAGRLNHHFPNALKKYRKQDWKWSVLARYIPIHELGEIEKLWIAAIDAYFGGYNSSLGGDGDPGHVKSEATRKKLREAMLGRTFSEETKQKMSEAKKGKPLSKEHAAKISRAHRENKYALGFHHTSETRQRMSETRKGSNNPNYKGGKYCNPSFCDCGQTKDLRAKRCLSCFNGKGVRDV